MTATEPLCDVRTLAPGELFRFRCHEGLSCFTDCCRRLTLALTPYDTLRLKNRLGLASSVFLERYTTVEQHQDDIFPQVLLAMNDDSRANCPFVEPNRGCTVYPDRPGACRTYPLGRGVHRKESGDIHELWVLLNEPHCRGFDQGNSMSVASWVDDQELRAYNQANDAMLPLLQHQAVRQGWRTACSPPGSGTYARCISRVKSR